MQRVAITRSRNSKRKHDYMLNDHVTDKIYSQSKPADSSQSTRSRLREKLEKIAELEGYPHCDKAQSSGAETSRVTSNVGVPFPVDSMRFNEADAPGSDFANLVSHPYAALFPKLEPAEMAELVKDIKENGQQVPITLYAGMILDGNNRYLACQLAGVKPRFENLADDIDPLAFVVSHNLKRRHLTASQRAAIAAELLPYEKSRAAKRQRNLAGTRANPDGSKPHQLPAVLPEAADRGEAREKVAEQLAVSSRLVSDAAKVKKAEPALFQKVKEGELTVNAAACAIAKTRNHSEATDAKSEAKQSTVVILRDASSNKAVTFHFRSLKAFKNVIYCNLWSPYESRPNGAQWTSHDYIFAVNVDPARWFKSDGVESLCRRSLRFMTLTRRGNTNPPAKPIPQTIEGDLAGVIKHLEDAWPGAQKIFIGEPGFSPKGWERSPAS